MHLDSAREASEIRDYINQQIKMLDKDVKVKLVEIGYQVDQCGLVKAFFGLSKDSVPDGSWTMSLADNILIRSHWPDLCESIDYEELTEKIGEIIKSVLSEIRDSGGFDKMAKYPDCQLGIEEINGVYSWPNYDDRGKENGV